MKNKFWTELEEKQDTKWITLLAVISAIAVIFIHVNACFFSLPVTDPIWLSSVVFIDVCYFAVPCFFMITGATLLNYPQRYSTKQYFWKRVKKTVIPYIIWSFISLGYLFARGWISTSQLTFEFFWTNLLVSPNWNENYWFFIPLFILYLIIPAFAFINEKYKDKVYFGVVLFGLIGTFTVSWILSLTNLGLNWPVALGMFYPIIYACLGYLIRKYDFTNWFKSIIYVIGFLSLIGMIVGVYFDSLNVGGASKRYISYSGLFVFFYSVAVILFFKNVGSKLLTHKKIYKPIQFLSAFTLPFYLTHKFIREILRDYFYKNLFNIEEWQFEYRLTVTILIILIIVGVVWILRKIPGVRKVTEYILPS